MDTLNDETTELDAFADKVQSDFPILSRQVHGHRLVYLDSAASSQRPAQVIDAMDTYYRTTHANVHRGAHTLGEEATAAYEGGRAKVAQFIGSPSSSEIVFTKNATEALNLVALAWGGQNLKANDRILLSTMEHHANIVPWFMIASRTGATVEWLPITDDGQIDMEAAERMIPGAKVLGCTAVSNVLGTITPIEDLCRLAKKHGVLSVVDASQSVPHLSTDVQQIGCDFLAFTGHKMCGPTGIGVLWGRQDLLESMPPFLGGGEMIKNVTFEGFEPNDVPWKFEAGTMPIAEVVGLAAAIDYLNNLGMDAIRAHEVGLVNYAFTSLSEAFGDKIRIFGPTNAQDRSGLISFELGDIHAHDIATILDAQGVAIRAGHHCAKPLMQTLDTAATARASFYLYNTSADVDVMIAALKHAAEIFGI